MRTGPVVEMGVAASTAPVGVATGTTSVGLVTAWFIILLLTTSIGLVTAVPRRPAAKLALLCVCVNVHNYMNESVPC